HHTLADDSFDGEPAAVDLRLDPLDDHSLPARFVAHPRPPVTRLAGLLPPPPERGCPGHWFTRLWGVGAKREAGLKPVLHHQTPDPAELVSVVRHQNRPVAQRSSSDQ